MSGLLFRFDSLTGLSTSVHTPQGHLGGSVLLPLPNLPKFPIPLFTRLCSTTSVHTTTTSLLVRQTTSPAISEAQLLRLAEVLIGAYDAPRKHVM